MDHRGGIRPDKFFRTRLLTAPPEQVTELLNDLARDRKELRKQVVSICWHMRGGISREEAWTLSYVERMEVVKFIEERIAFVEKTGVPLL